MKEKVRVAAAQPMLLGDLKRHRDGNLDKAIGMIQEAAKNGVQVVCLPELFMGGTIVESIPGPCTAELCGVAEQYSLYIIAHLWERAEEGIYSSSPLIGPEGKILGVFRKVHLFPWESSWFGAKAGSTLPVYETDLGVMGILICHDAMIPEAARVLVLEGAEILFIPSRMPGNFLIPWEDVIRIRALENQVFIVTAGVAGQHACGTLIAAPKFRGDVLAFADSSEQIIWTDLDLEWLRGQRKDSPLYTIKNHQQAHELEDKIETHCFLKDRRPDTYQAICTG